MPGRQVSAAEFARWAIELHDAAGVAETLETIAQFALQAVPCKHAAVALVGRGRSIEPATATDSKFIALSQRDVAESEGPLVEAARTDHTILIEDLDTEERWTPQWRRQTLTAEVRSAIYAPVVFSGRAQAVLSLYHDEPGALGADDVRTVGLLNVHAGIALDTARQEETLAEAVAARKLIGQAMGILMEQYGLDGDKAFQVLRRYSQAANRKLHDIAQDVIVTRKLPH